MQQISIKVVELAALWQAISAGIKIRQGLSQRHCVLVIILCLSKSVRLVEVPVADTRKPRFEAADVCQADALVRVLDDF